MVGQPLPADQTEVSQEASQVTRTPAAVPDERKRDSGQHKEQD